MELAKKLAAYLVVFAPVCMFAKESVSALSGPNSCNHPRYELDDFIPGLSAYSSDRETKEPLTSSDFKVEEETGEAASRSMAVNVARALSSTMLAYHRGDKEEIKDLLTMLDAGASSWERLSNSFVVANLYKDWADVALFYARLAQMPEAYSHAARIYQRTSDFITDMNVTREEARAERHGWPVPQFFKELPLKHAFAQAQAEGLSGNIAESVRLRSAWMPPQELALLIEVAEEVGGRTFLWARRVEATWRSYLPPGPQVNEEQRKLRSLYADALRSIDILCHPAEYAEIIIDILEAIEDGRLAYDESPQSVDYIESATHQFITSVSPLAYPRYWCRFLNVAQNAVPTRGKNGVKWHEFFQDGNVFCER